MPFSMSSSRSGQFSFILQLSNISPRLHTYMCVLVLCMIATDVSCTTSDSVQDEMCVLVLCMIATDVSCTTSVSVQDEMCVLVLCMIATDVSCTTSDSVQDEITHEEYGQ